MSVQTLFGSLARLKLFFGVTLDRGALLAKMQRVFPRVFAHTHERRKITDESRLSYWLKGQPQQNFGDYLSEFLFGKLFFPSIGLNARAIHLIGSVIDDAHVPSVSAGPDSGADSDEGGHIVFWGCGVRTPGGLTPEQRQRTRILSVRGPLSASELHLAARVPQGDSALLLPSLYSPQPSEPYRGKAVCIPHFHDHRSDAELLATSGCDRVLRPNIAADGHDVPHFIDAVFAADFVLSASLHGAIVAAVYDRPFAFWDNGRIDVPFKWADFAASVCIPAEFQTCLEDARTHYELNIRPRLRIRPMLPSLANAPFLPRPEAILKALRRELSAVSAEEMLSVLDRRIADFELTRPHFDTLINDFKSRSGS